MRKAVSVSHWIRVSTSKCHWIRRAMSHVHFFWYFFLFENNKSKSEETFPICREITVDIYLAIKASNVMFMYLSFAKTIVRRPYHGEVILGRGFLMKNSWLASARGRMCLVWEILESTALCQLNQEKASENYAEEVLIWKAFKSCVAKVSIVLTLVSQCKFYLPESF